MPSGGKSLKTWHGQATIEALNIEIGRALTPRMELAFVFAPMYIRQPRSWFGDQFGDGVSGARSRCSAPRSSPGHARF